MLLTCTTASAPALWSGEQYSFHEEYAASLDTSGPQFQLAYRRRAPDGRLPLPFAGWFGNFRLVARERAHGSVIAMAEALQRDHRATEARGLVISYAVHPDWAGRGLGTLCAAATVLGALERFPDAACVWAELYPENLASARLARRLGLAPSEEHGGGLATFAAASAECLVHCALILEGADAVQEAQAEHLAPAA